MDSLLSSQFWMFFLPLLASVVAAWYQFRSFRLQRRQTQSLPRQKGAATKTDPSSAVRWRWMPMAVLVLSLINWAPYVYSRTISVTPENVQIRVRQWMDTFHWASQEEPHGNEVYFAYVATLANGRKVRIERTKEFPQYITFSGSITSDKSAQELVDRLSQLERNRLRWEVSLDLSRARIAMFVDENLRLIVVSTRVPITPTLSEAEFISRVDDIDFAIAGALATLALHIPTSAAQPPR
jgi:hypothetical protein